MSMDPPIAVTIGDPAGIGPEVALKALRRPPRGASFLLLGPPALWRAAARRLRLPLRHPVLDTGGPDRIRAGRPSAASGEVSFRAVAAGARLAREGAVLALVTAPISKTAWHAAGRCFPGHTEFLAKDAGRKDSETAMLLAAGAFRVGLLSVHVPLRRALRLVRAPRILEKLAVLREGLRRWFGVPNPRLAVAGLNPHAGEGGAFGDEERRRVAPAVARSRCRGWRVSGPHPPDSVFRRALLGEFDAVLALYHDQGLVAVKTAAFGRAVNVTLGLPYPRTSPDHGTAFDLAGRGTADACSMSEAVRLAAQIAERIEHGGPGGNPKHQGKR